MVGEGALDGDIEVVVAAIRAAEDEVGDGECSKFLGAGLVGWGSGGESCGGEGQER